MIHTGFESTKAIHTLLSDFAPKPITWGTYKTIPDTHLFVSQYREMVDEMPDPHNFSTCLVAIHTTASLRTADLAST